jgi:hypothetical protein
MYRSFLSLFLAVGLLPLVACSGGPTDPDDIPDDTITGRLSVFLNAMESTNALPPNVESVWLRMEDVLVRSGAEGWISIGDDRRDLDLMTLRGGDALQIGTGMIYEGAYDALRILIADSWIIVGGVQKELEVKQFLNLPGNGHDFAADFFVDENVTTRVGMSWDLDTQLRSEDDVWTLGSEVTVTVALN